MQALELYRGGVKQNVGQGSWAHTRRRRPRIHETNGRDKSSAGTRAKGSAALMSCQMVHSLIYSTGIY